MKYSAYSEHSDFHFIADGKDYRPGPDPTFGKNMLLPPGKSLYGEEFGEWNDDLEKVRCPHCQSSVPEDAEKCFRCGQPLSRTTPPWGW